MLTFSGLMLWYMSNFTIVYFGPVILIYFANVNISIQATAAVIYYYQIVRPVWDRYGMITVSPAFIALRHKNYAFLHCQIHICILS